MTIRPHIHVGLTISLVLLSSASMAAQWHDVADIRAAAERTLGGNGVHAEATSLDQRLRLAVCTEPLVADPGRAAPGAARVTVRVACQAPNWSLYVPVRLSRQQSVVVLTRAVNRGHVITAADVEVITRQARSGYPVLRDAAHAVGQRLRRPAAAGTELTPSWLETPAVIRRGQRVILVARSGGLEIRTNGEAMSDGGTGQQIQVRNLSSGRMVSARVRNGDIVDVAF